MKNKTRNCEICNKYFTAKYPSSKVRTCSYECKIELVRQNTIKQFIPPEAHLKTSITTKAGMANIDMKSILKENRRSYSGEGHPLFGKPCTEERKDKISKANIGKKKGLTWEEIIGVEEAQKRKLENANTMSRTNARLLNERTSKIEKEIAAYLIPYGFLCNKKISKYTVDLVNEQTKIIIEVYGDYWHANPILYQSNFYIQAAKMTAEEKWLYDIKRKERLEQLGYKVCILWEKDIKERGAKECLNDFEELINKK